MHSTWLSVWYRPALPASRLLSPSGKPSSYHSIIPYPPHHLVSGLVDLRVSRVVGNPTLHSYPSGTLRTQEQLQFLHHFPGLNLQTEDLLDPLPHQVHHPRVNDAMLVVLALVLLVLLLFFPPALLPDVALLGLPLLLLLFVQIAKVLPFCRHI